MQTLCRAIAATGRLSAQQVVKNEHGEEVSDRGWFIAARPDCMCQYMYVAATFNVASLCISMCSGQLDCYYMYTCI